MKELTYEEWLRNPTPRMMWVWDENEKDKVQRKVVYVVKGGHRNYPVRATTDDDTVYEAYRHCAEIENQRLMTHRELARWLCEKPFREFKYGNGTNCPVYKYHTYTEDEAPKEVCKDIRIRDDGGEWQEPLIEVEL